MRRSVKPGSLYLLGAATHNDHLRETGVLGAEAVIDASLVAGALKLATNRERPDVGSGTGGFWPHGPSDYSVTTSFPSAHAASSWALARVISDEYKGWPVKLGAYGFAAAISASRITARRHFPSDVVVGGTLGYLIGGYVVRHHSSAGQERKQLHYNADHRRVPADLRNDSDVYPQHQAICASRIGLQEIHVSIPLGVQGLTKDASGFSSILSIS